MSESTTPKTATEILRQPFPPNQISLLPKQLRRDDQDRGKCDPSTGRTYSSDGRYCGGYHAKSIHLDYVGHAALTDRLLDADPEWNWKPVSIDQDGLPLFDRQGGLWIELTVGGVTRLGYGDAQGKTGPNATKEAIGDALRNAGMRFGAALDLWHKGDLHDAAEQQGATERPQEPAGAPRATSRGKSAGSNQSKPVAAAPAAEEHDWIGAAEKVTTTEDLRTLYRTAKAAGSLGTMVPFHGEEIRLEEYLTTLGTALADKEKRAAGEIQADPATGEVS